MAALDDNDPAKILVHSIIDLLDKHDGRDALAALALTLATGIAYGVSKDPDADSPALQELREDLMEFARAQLKDRDIPTRES